jgi:protease I
MGQNQLGQVSAQPLGVIELGQLLWATAIGTALVQTGVPQAQLTAYVVTADGIYRYVPMNHTLEQVTAQPLLAALCMSIIPQQPAAGCGILIATPARARSRSDNPIRSALLLETGQRLQNLRLQATAMGLGMVVAQQFDGPSIAKALGLPRETEILAVVLAGYKEGQATAPIGPTSSTTQQRRTVLVVATRGFREEELIETKKVLDQAGIQTFIVSSRPGLLTGMSGGVAYASASLNQLRVDDLDALVFIGGTGAVEFANDQFAHGLARAALERRKVVAAICIAPTILANAGLLRGVRATAYPTEQQALVAAGAVFTGNLVERDGLIITANGPTAATAFGQAIVAALQGT